MPEENITTGALPGDAHVTPSDAQVAVGSESQSGDALTLAELNQHLGKNFTSKEAALKSFKDTFSFVGTRREDIEKEVLSKVATKDETSAMAQELATIRKEMFYKDNPEYNDPNMRTLIDKLGGNPAEVVQSAEFKAVFEKVKGFDETQKLRTVLDSNPRLASSRDALQKAREMRAQGASTDQVSQLVVEALLSQQ